MDSDQFRVHGLMPRKRRSPLKLSTIWGDGIGNFVPDEARVRYQAVLSPDLEPCEDVLIEKAGPREYIHFDPAQTRAAIVTCGGLCPGLNNVIRSAFFELHHNYGVKEVFGIRYGYMGMNPASRLEPVPLTREYVETIHERGGTVLGSSRGSEDLGVMVDFLVARRINLLFCIGGDGTQHGARAIADEALRRGADIAVIGVPKTIDNDIMYVSRTFGFNTALEKAREIIDCAHVEATGAPNGIGLVKLMGRNAGFIAAGATLASQEVNFTLVPECPFKLEGKQGFLPMLMKRIRQRGHAVIAVAEGAGQDLFTDDDAECDASGNRRNRDIGLFLKDAIAAYATACKVPLNLKYFDPSYIIRSVPANADDSLFCNALARHAVHAAMAGKTGVLIGLWNDQFVHIPIATAIAEKKQVSLESELWLGVIEATGQPHSFS
ncbi:MAG: ATP-dependent 6-phosphofructokinase [Candidatus Hydrogenedentes bacterium]|nr:ATP-dependent 6-phosphofructokinase [Candidatus Hydrogenedentota bacterium]